VPSALVTGGAGFIGSHVAELFLARGYTVEILDNLSSGKREHVDSRARLHEMDVRPTIAQALEGSHADRRAHRRAQDPPPALGLLLLSRGCRRDERWR